MAGKDLAKAVYYKYRRLAAKRRRQVDVPAIWSSALPEEVGFWDAFLAGQGLEWPDDYRRRLDPASAVVDPLILRELARVPKSHVSILDVGAGPLSCVGKTYPGKLLKVTATDPLADKYDALLSRHSIEPPIRTVACAAERLRELFEPGTFDIAYARNSLDHSYDPLAAIRSMIEMVTPQGVVILRHKAHEAENAKYWGLHQWNFDCDAGRFVIWAPGVEHDVSAVLGRDFEVECQREDEWVNCRISRRL